MANPTPVLPLVGSIIVAPGVSNHFLSASSIIAIATLSFALPAGLNASTLAIMGVATPLAADILPSSTIGVLPISSVMLFAIIFDSLIVHRSLFNMKLKEVRGS
jgi:hypothetical protein